MPSAPTPFRVAKLRGGLLAGARLPWWGVVSWLVITLSGCVSLPRPQDWETRLQGNAIVLLGEVHDNREHHQQRLQVLRRAFAQGWRPAIAMEQFDRERQADIDRARRAPNADAQRVIDAAAPSTGRSGGNWNWDFYRPFVALALEYDVPLIAANLSAVDTNRVVREGYAAVFDDATLRRLRLDQAVPPNLQAAQAREIDIGHCNALPGKMLPTMARGQMARDAVMADLLAQNAVRGVVLIAGNGHVRRDIGVPYWLSDALRARALAVGYLEQGAAPRQATAFDAVVYTASAERDDPCIAFKQRLNKPPPTK
jgi:uncharacterized iron-regulated protein